MSLATFIGGRATGPRLNKHAPQLDVTDPTLFEQRSISTSSVPHPVFGRGGIAMPGLTSRGRGVVSPIQDHEIDSPASTSSTQVHFPIAKDGPVSSNTEPVPISNSDHGSGMEASRQLRASIPSTTLPPPTLPPQSLPGSPRPLVPRSPNFEARSPPPTFGSKSSFEKSPTLPPSKPSAPAFITPKKPAIVGTSSPASGVKHPTFSAPTPSLPGLEASTPKVTPLTSQRRIPSLHPPKEKDPTPSISRLKGRGFVQSMVKASSALEAAAVGSAVVDVGKLNPAKSSPSIVSRWKPESSQSSSSQPATTSVPTHFRKSWTPSAASPSPQRTVTQRKSWTTSEPQKVEESEHERPTRPLDQRSASSVRVVESHQTGRSTHAAEQQHTGQSPRVLAPEQTEHPPRKAPSLPSLSTPSQRTTPPASPGGHGLGSSSTMFSYIKPMKTGDDPAAGPSLPHSRPTTPHSRASAGGLKSTQNVDELGHRTGVNSGGQRQRNGVGGFPPPSGRPLVHVRP